MANEAILLNYRLQRHVDDDDDGGDNDDDDDDDDDDL